MDGGGQAGCRLTRQARHERRARPRIQLQPSVTILIQLTRAHLHHAGRGLASEHGTRGERNTHGHAGEVHAGNLHRYLVEVGQRLRRRNGRHLQPQRLDDGAVADVSAAWVPVRVSLLEQPHVPLLGHQRLPHIDRRAGVGDGRHHLVGARQAADAAHGAREQLGIDRPLVGQDGEGVGDAARAAPALRPHDRVAPVLDGRLAEQVGVREVFQPPVVHEEQPALRADGDRRR